RQHFEVREAPFSGKQLVAVRPGVHSEFGEPGFHPVDAALDHARRMSDALRLTVNHPHDLAYFANRVADRAKAALCHSAALDTRLDLGGHRARLSREFRDRRSNLAR